MKNKMKTMDRNEEAVSPVIGVILMVAVTVILAAVIAAFVFSMGPPKQAPQASLRAIDLDLAASTVTIEHQGGADIVLADTKIIIEQGTNRTSYQPSGNSTDRYSAGDKLRIGSDEDLLKWNNAETTHGSPQGTLYPISSGSEVSITFVDVPSGQQIANMKIRA